MYGNERRRSERERYRPRRYEDERGQGYQRDERERLHGTPEQRRYWEQEGRKIEEGYHPELYTDPRYEREEPNYYQPRSYDERREDGYWRERQEPRGYSRESGPPQDFRGESRWYPEPYRRGYQPPPREGDWMRDASDFQQESPRERERRYQERSWEDEGSRYGTYNSERRGDRRAPEHLRNQQGYQERYSYDRSIGPGQGGHQQGYRPDYENERRDWERGQRERNQPETYEQVPRYQSTYRSGQPREFDRDGGRQGPRRVEDENPAQRKVREMDREERQDRRASREAQLSPQGTQVRAARGRSSNTRPRRGGAVIGDRPEGEVGGS